MARRQGSQPTRPVHDDDEALPRGGAAGAAGGGAHNQVTGGVEATDDPEAQPIARASRARAGAAVAGAGAGLGAVGAGATAGGAAAAGRTTGTAAIGRGRPRGITGRALRGLPGGRQDDTPLALDRLIHERLRLGIVSALAVNDALTFVELKGLLHTTDGNLSVHARKLEEAGYISCTKEFDGRTPRTEYRLTRAGRHALERYLDHMEALIKATRGPQT